MQLTEDFAGEFVEMEGTMSGILAAAAAAAAIFLAELLFLQRSRRRKMNLPPRPRGRLPLLGHLRLLDPAEAAHQTFARLSAQTGGALTMLYMGSKPTLLVSPAAMAEQVLKHHDRAFASRPALTAGKTLGFDFKSVVFAPLGAYHKRLRRIYTAELLSPRRVALSQALRQTEVQHVMGVVLAASGGVVNMTSVLQEMGIDNLVRMIFAKPHLGGADCVTREEMVALKAVVKQAVSLAGVPYAGDYIPLLDVYDFTGHKAKLQRVAWRMFTIAMQQVERHRSSKEEASVDADKLNLVDLLLSHQGEEKLPDHAVAAILFDFIIAGSDTTSVSIEWALAELLHHPHHLKRLQEELDAVVGRDRLVDESDIRNLPFTQAVVKELFRFHPAAPLGIPHCNTEPTTLAGYDIPARTIVMLNLWAIGRDPACWKDPLAFNPDRFLDGPEVAMMGKDFQLIPFSVGRRQCPGAALGLAVVQLAVGSLVHGFEWSAAHGQKPEEIDMREKPGLVTPRMSDLLVKAVPRLPLQVYQSGQHGMQNGNGH